MANVYIITGTATGPVTCSECLVQNYKTVEFRERQVMAETEEAAKLAAVRWVNFDFPDDLYWTGKVVCEPEPRNCRD